MGIKNTMDKACPHLIFDGIDTTFTEIVETPEGWKFWRHTAPNGKVRNCQFCEKVGRKYDVFECINESEWRVCPYNRTMKPDDTIIKVVCAWCGKDLGTKDGKGQTGISHGMCPECARDFTKTCNNCQEER